MADEEDDTPTKRAKVRSCTRGACMPSPLLSQVGLQMTMGADGLGPPAPQDLEDGLYGRHAWPWGRSPRGLLGAGPEEVGMQLEPCSLSELSTSTEADLCCGESFGRATPHPVELAPGALAGACLPLACAEPEAAAEDEGVVQEMIR